MVIYQIILFRLSPAMDRNSTGWFSAQWATAGRPVIPLPEWDRLMEKVGVMVEREAIH